MKEEIYIRTADDCRRIINYLKHIECEIDSFCKEKERQYIQNEFLGKNGREPEFIDKIKNEAEKLTKTEEVFECFVKYLEQTQEFINEMEKEPWEKVPALFK